MRSFLLIGFFKCCLVWALFSQDLHYSIRNYTAADGLPQSQITNILEDQNGYLWMGTQGGGLTRFDGHEFKVYTVKDGLLANEVLDIYFDKPKRLWALHQHGITRFDGLYFKTYQIPDSLSAMRFHKIYEVSDTIFLLSEGGLLSKIYRDSVICWEKPGFNGKKIRNVHVAPKGELLFQLSKGKFLLQTRSRIDSVSSTDETGMIYNFFNWKQQLLARTEKGIFKLDLTQNTFSKLPWNTKGSVLMYDEQRNIFWTTDWNNLVKESFQNEKLLRGDTILKDVGINKIFFDSEGNTWIGTDGHGLYRYYMMDFYKIIPENKDGVMAILADDSNDEIWIGTMGKGILKIKNGKAKSYFNKRIYHQNFVTTIKKDSDGTVWAGTRGGLGQYDRKTDSFKWFTTKEGLPGNFAMCVDPDEQGGLWIGTNRGISYHNGNIFKVMNDIEGLPKDLACWSLHYSKQSKTLFIGTDVRLIAIHENKARIISIPRLKNAVITSIHPYRDSLLVLSTGGAGIVILDPQTEYNFFITSHEGLASDFNYFATEDEKGYLWIGSEKGINCIKLNESNKIIQNLHYGFDNGLTGVETNQNAFAFNGAHKYFGLIDGVYSFNNQQLTIERSFDLHLSDVEILYGEYSARSYADSLSGFFKIPYNPQLPPDRNHVTFYFNRVDKQHPNSVKYKYILENFDKAWSLPSSMQQVTYGNLPPGDYIFRVKATNSAGSWSDKEIAYPFTVRSPFYMRASFIIGLFILLAGIITLVLYLRVKQRIRKVVQLERIRTQEQETLRKEIARDFHDEMGNQLTRIINYISLLKLNNNNGHNHTELYGKVEESAKYLYNGTRDFIWAIDPGNDELSKLFIHIRDFGEKLFEEKNISFRAFNDLKDCVKLPYGFSREANLIFKEAMTNAFKYSQAKNVTFSLHKEEDHYEMILADDGIGFYTGHLEKTNGLKNIRERADRINGILRISSVKDHGTQITLNFKLNKTLKYGFTL